MSSTIILANHTGPTIVETEQLDPPVTLTAFSPFSPGFTGGASLAVSATGELAIGAGPGGGPEVMIYDASQRLLHDFFAFDPAFTGGVNVAWLDPTDLAVGAGAGGLPQVEVFDVATGQLTQDFLAFNPAYTGGVTVAGIDAGHVAVATQGGRPAEVKIFDVSTATATADFLPFGVSFTGAISIAASAFDWLAVGAGSGGGPEVKIYDASQRLLDDFFAFNPTFTGGVNVTWLDATHLAVATARGASEVRVFDIANNNNLVDDILPLPPALATAGISLAQVDTTPCYCRGTRIATAHGETPVERLVIGDHVVTMSGAARPIKWIGRRSYSGRFILGRTDVLPICIKAGALEENVPRRDLWISPHHAMYLDGVLIEARDLVNGTSIVQAEAVDGVEYFHVELENHDIIIAEGALSESFIDDDSRGMFHNADEYRSLYPDVQTAARYCAPRRDAGYEVGAARARIETRAGLRPAQPHTTPGLRGFVDFVSAEKILGWAQNLDHPEAPVCLDIFVGNCLIGQVLANRHRDDLQRVCIGSGSHSFAFIPPPGLSFAPWDVEVRRSLDGAILRSSSDLHQSAIMSAMR